MSPRIYLDHAATTPVVPAARAAFTAAMDVWANPSSPHAEGRAARRMVEDARQRIKAALGWDGELIFTASATEAADLAFRKARADGARVALSSVEHDALRRQWPEDGRTDLPVNEDGLIDRARLGDFLSLSRSATVAVQHVNSETGVIQPIREIAADVASAGSVLLVDCAQSAGKMELPPADMIIVGAHKFGGVPGAAALLVKDLRLLVPTSGQERGYRPGTENVPAIMAMAAALETRPTAMQDAAMERMQACRTSLDQVLAGGGGNVIGESAPRSPMIGSYAMPGMSAQAQLVRLDGMGFAVSAGSACASGSMKPSHVLAAMNVPADVAARTIRVSFSFDTSRGDVDAFADAWMKLAAEARRRAA